MKITEEERAEAADLPICWQEKILLSKWFIPSVIGFLIAAIQIYITHWVFDADAASVLSAKDLDSRLSLALAIHNIQYLVMIYVFFGVLKWYSTARYRFVAVLRVIDLRIKKKLSRKKGEAK